MRVSSYNNAMEYEMMELLSKQFSSVFYIPSRNFDKNDLMVSWLPSLKL